ncbi:helix-turn-helix domain-containing protein [Rathayibacter sp. Leaf248]|uniref:helix-turn-helix domain-containing protein n=1 Tax=Rathayibacter sp. Leaf248 TaxID=2876555 RepID=UPI001E3C93EF|nr:helix-turn-helix transcriptional regulator [Rathayibacter sp. Leaf248]
MTDEPLEAIQARADDLVESHQRLLEDLIGMRREHKLSQAVVAERMGVSQSTVSTFERYDSNPTLATIRRYALAVGARIHHTVSGEHRVEASSWSSSVLSNKRPSKLFSNPWVFTDSVLRPLRNSYVVDWDIKTGAVELGAAYQAETWRTGSDQFISLVTEDTPGETVLVHQRRSPNVEVLR